MNWSSCKLAKVIVVRQVCNVALLISFLLQQNSTLSQRYTIVFIPRNTINIVGLMCKAQGQVYIITLGKLQVLSPLPLSSYLSFCYGDQTRTRPSLPSSNLQICICLMMNVTQNDDFTGTFFTHAALILKLMRHALGVYDVKANCEPRSVVWI